MERWGYRTRSTAWVRKGSREQINGVSQAGDVARGKQWGSAYLPAQGVQPHHCPVVGTKGADRVGQYLLQGQQDLVVQAAHQVTVSPEEMEGLAIYTAQMAKNGHKAEGERALPQRACSPTQQSDRRCTMALWRYSTCQGGRYHLKEVHGNTSLSVLN